MYAHDQLTHKIKPEEFGIINLDVSTGKGTHWVAYFNSKKHKDVYYFDSFGVMPDTRTIKFLQGNNLFDGIKKGKPVAFNTSQFQNVKSSRCGWYCKTWLKNMASGLSFYDSLYKDFTQIPSDNNEALVKK